MKHETMNPGPTGQDSSRYLTPDEDMDERSAYLRRLARPPAAALRTLPAPVHPPPTSVGRFVDLANPFADPVHPFADRARLVAPASAAPPSAASTSRGIRRLTMPQLVQQLLKRKSKKKDELPLLKVPSPPRVYDPATGVMRYAVPRVPPWENAPLSAFSPARQQSPNPADVTQRIASRSSLPRSVSPVRRLQLNPADLCLPLRRTETLLPWYESGIPTGIVLAFNGHSRHSTAVELRLLKVMNVCIV